MVNPELVDAAGYISEDSSFYGDEDMKSQYEELERSRPERTFHSPVKTPAFKKLKRDHSQPARDDHILTKKVKREIKSEPQSDQDAMSFLKSRPQVARLEAAHAKATEPAKREKPRLANGKEVLDLVEVPDRYKDHPAAWQRNESIEDFLRRLPVNDPATAAVGPWLWVGSPFVPYAQSTRKQEADIEGFQDSGEALLDAFLLLRGQTESENPGKVPATITRKLAPYRDQLEIDLLTLAVKTGTTYGKWMLFPPPSEVANIWRSVATATAAGRLGPTSKAATIDPADPSIVICVYTYDFSDFDDVSRVLNGLVEAGLCRADGKAIYYKCDGYTYLNIKSGNEFKLRPSLYSSKEILNHEVKALAGGPVARLKKSSKKMTDYFELFKGDDIS